jgi:hypothetical protein
MLSPATTARLIKACERVDGVSGGAEEARLRLLAVPALQMEALWVTRDQGGDSFILLKSPGGTPLSAIDFVEEARQLIRIRRESILDAAMTADATEPSELGA